MASAKATKSKKETATSSLIEDSFISSKMDSFVFMDKTIAVLDIGLKTGKNVILYGPGGHGGK